MARQELTVVVQLEGGRYPPGVSISQTLRLTERRVSIETTHANKGEQAAPVNFGEHCYFWTPQHWEELRLNGQPVDQAVRQNGIISLEQENRIEIPGYASLLLRQRGLPLAVLWTGQSPQGSFDSHYVCIEPVEGDPVTFFSSPESHIGLGGSRQTTLELEILAET